MRVSQTVLAQPDMFAQQNAAGLALTLADPVLVDDLGLKGAVINLWEILAGGIPPPPAPPLAAASATTPARPAACGRGLMRWTDPTLTAASSTTTARSPHPARLA